MKRLCWFLALLAATVTSVKATTVPMMFFEVGETHVDVPLQEDENGCFVDHFEYEAPGWSVNIENVRLNPDPLFVYSFGVAAFGAPQQFTFVFAVPFVTPQVAPIVSASISGTLTDGQGNGAYVMPFGQPLVQAMELISPSTSANAGVDVGPFMSVLPGYPGVPFPYGPYTAGPISGPVNPNGWTAMRMILSFELSDDPLDVPDDFLELHGFASSEPVPEPASIVLLAVGLIGLAVKGKGKRT